MSDDHDEHDDRRTTGDDPFTVTAGPYVLGALTPGDRDAFERHLRVCGGCRGSVEDLAGLPGLLSRVPREVVDALASDDPAALAAVGEGPAALPGAAGATGAGDDAVTLPDTVLPRLLREVRRSRRRRRVLAAGGLVAACAAVVTVLVTGPSGTDRQAVPATTLSAPAASPSATAPAQGPVQTMDPLLEVPVTATARLTEVGWGTQVDITCAYAAAAADQPYDYALVVKDRGGATERLGTWTAVPGRDASLSGATAWPRDRIAAVEVQTLQGTAVLRLTET